MSPPRAFPPLYAPTGNPSVDRLAFIHVLEQLKTQKRTGWAEHKIPYSESISDHMYRMALLALSSDSDSELDISKCVSMALVHDLAEAHVGDITPRECISRAEKQRREHDAMQNFLHGMLHGTPAARRMEALWEEYEAGETPEARFVKDLDRFEMAAQALEYEKRYWVPTPAPTRIDDQAAALPPTNPNTLHMDENLQQFFDGSVPRIMHPEVRGWAATLMAEREKLWASGVAGNSVGEERGEEGSK